MNLLRVRAEAFITPRRLMALHINAAGECRRAAAESARSGQVVGFYGPALHKESARRYLEDARSRRLGLAYPIY